MRSFLQKHTICLEIATGRRLSYCPPFLRYWCWRVANAHCRCALGTRRNGVSSYMPSHGDANEGLRRSRARSCTAGIKANMIPVLLVQISPVLQIPGESSRLLFCFLLLATARAFLPPHRSSLRLSPQRASLLGLLAPTAKLLRRHEHTTCCGFVDILEIAGDYLQSIVLVNRACTGSGGGRVAEEGWTIDFMLHGWCGGCPGQMTR